MRLLWPIAFFALYAFAVSLDDHSLWSIFARLEYNEMITFAEANPSLLEDGNVRALLECHGHHQCAFRMAPSRLLYNWIPHHLDKRIIRMAAMLNDESAVKEMIKAGIDPKWLDYPYKRALRMGNTNEAHWIRSLMPSYLRNIEIPVGDSALDTDRLTEAIDEGRLEQVIEMIKDGVDVNTVQPDGGLTFLMTAAFEGHVQILNALIDAGALLNAQDDSGQTALIYAAQRGHLDIVKALIRVNADVNIENTLGNTALLNAVQRAHTQVIDALIEAGADVNIPGVYGMTALLITSSNGNYTIAKKLIEAGADVEARGPGGMTALMAADNPKIANMLLDAGADINAWDYEGATAVELARDRQGNDSDLVRYLKLKARLLSGRKYFFWPLSEREKAALQQEIDSILAKYKDQL